jgi:hypothetical protein
VHQCFQFFGTFGNHHTTDTSHFPRPQLSRL